MSEDTALPVKGCLPKISDTWHSVFGTITSANRVHPSDPIPPKDSEFIFIESNIKIRVIHLVPEKVRQSLLIKQEVPLNKNSSSVTEEYWFMRNKPLRATSCNCSFRKSLRNSNISNGFNRQKDISVNNCVESSFANSAKANNIDKVNEFAEQLIEHTMNDAFNECLKITDTNGIDNLAYEKSEVDSAVTTRQNNFKKCVHKKMKPLIILIHGLGSTADIWSILMHNLSCRGFEVVAPDLLGHGYSSAPNKTSLYYFKNLVSQTMAVFDYFMKKDDKRKCILIGHSYGCSLITALYPNRATKIAQLVLISGGGPTPLAPPADMNDISPYGWAHNLCYPFMYCGLKRSFFYSSRGKNFKFCEDESTVPPHLKGFLIQGQYWPEGDASFHRRILVPTLLVHGLQDKYVTLVQECEMERTIPRSFLELIPDAGHMSMLESPEHLTHMVDCFLEMWT